MATPQRRIEANRANALKSTGPRTQRGKRSSARNALVTAIAGGGGAVARFTPVQNEDNRPAGGGASQVEPPQADAAGGEGPGGEKGASSEAK